MRWLLVLVVVGSVTALQRELRLDGDPKPLDEDLSEPRELLKRETRKDPLNNQSTAKDAAKEFYSKEPDGPNIEEGKESNKREPYVDEEPSEEQIRGKRCSCEEEPAPRTRREANPDGARRPQQIHQYEVYETTDDFAAPVPAYEQMLAASVDHYHRIRPAPAALYQDPVSPQQTVLHIRNYPDPVSPPVPKYPPVNQLHPTVPHVRHNLNPPVYVNPASESVSNPVSFSGVWSPSVRDSVSAAMVGPAPVQAEPLPVSSRLAAGDQLPAAGHHQHASKHKHASNHGHEAGGGKSAKAGHHRNHGGKTTKGFKTSHHSDEGKKGHKTDEKHRKEYEDVQGQTKKHHDHADHKGGHEEEAHGVRGAHFDEKKGHKKGHKTKGYHNKYHKDEFHKEHKFYDDFHKSGSHHRFGHFHAKHAANESGKKKAHHVDAGHDVKEHGKKGYSNKGHLDADHKGFKGGQGHEEHSHKHAAHAKKGGHQGGKHWGHQRGKQ